VPARCTGLSAVRAPEFNPLSEAIISAGYAKSRAGATPGHDPNKFDWPALLRKLNRIDPTYKE
jgi:hypothetical protein